MPDRSLKSCSFKWAYDPSEDLTRDLYVPALSHSVGYDCLVGSFSPSALASAAIGAEVLIGRQGKMRLLAGAAAIGRERLSEELLRHLNVKDAAIRRRLEALARMAAGDALRIRLLLPREAGRGISFWEDREGRYPEAGIFTDGEGLQVALLRWPMQGGPFLAFRSWDAGAPYVAAVHRHFERLWEGREPGWTTVPLPDPVMKRLIGMRPLKPLLPDHPDPAPSAGRAVAPDLKEKLVFQFLRDVPDFPGEPEFPPASDLERRLTGTETLKACWEKHPAIRDAWFLRWQSRRFEVTFYRECFEEHRESLIFMICGEPLLQSLLQAAAVLKSPEDCQVPLVRQAVAASGFPVAYYRLAGDEAKPVKNLDSLEAVLRDGLPEGGITAASEVRAREHFGAVLRKRMELREREDRDARRSALREREDRGKSILTRSALCDIVRARHATLFDQNLIAADFDEATLLRQGEKSPILAGLISLLAAEGLKPSLSDPFLKEIEGKSEADIRALEASLLGEAEDLLGTMAASGDRDGGRIAGPVMDTQRFYKSERKEQPPLMLMLSPPAKERYTRYLPFYGIAAAVEKHGRRKGLREEGWMEVEPGRRLSRTMWVTRMQGQAMAPLIADGDFAVFDAAVPEDLNGQILLVQAGAVDDPDLGPGVTIRRFEGLQPVRSRHGVRYGEIRMEPLNPEYPSIVLREVRSADFKVIGRYVGGV